MLGNACPVDEDQPLLFARQRGVQLRHLGVQLIRRPQPPGKHIGSQLEQLLIPVFELLGVSIALADLVQQGVALSEDPVVARERRAVKRINLTEGDVQKVSPLLGGAGHQGDVLREEEDHIQLAHDVHGAAIDAVQADLPAKSCRRRVFARLPLLHQCDLDGMLLPSPHIGALKARIGYHLRIGRPGDELPIRRGQGGPGGGKVVDGLDQVRFALCVLALQQSNTRRDVNLQARIVAKVFQREALEVHLPANGLHAWA